MKRRRSSRKAARTPSAAALRKRVSELELVIDGLHEGLYEWNIVSGELSYSDRGEVLGFPTDAFRRVEDWVERIHPDDREKYRLANVAHFKGVTPRFLCEYRYRAPDGSWRWARTHGMAVRDRKGRAVRVVGSTGDITELKRAEEALRRSEERYALATSAAVEGIYEWDVATGALYLTERAKEFFSFPAEALTPAGWTERVHADDREAYKQAIVDHFKGRTPHLEHEYRITDSRGGWKWILDRGTGVRDARGRVVKVVGALSDISRRKLMQDTVHLLSRLEPDVQPVLDTIARNAVELCGGGFGVVFRFDGERLHLAATHNFTPAASAALRKKFPMRPDRSQLAGRAALSGEVQRIEEVLADPDYDQDVARGAGWRRGLAVPLLHEARTLGVIAVSWTAPGGIPEWQVDVLKSLASQAVIALENARLYKETSEALQGQTATAEVLRVMSRSPNSVQPVFDAIARSAVRLCDAAHCSLYQLEGGLQRPVAHHGLAPDMISHLEQRYGRAPHPRTVTGHVLLRREVVRIEDTLADQRFPESHVTQRLAGDRAVLAVPMLKDDQPVGAILVGRREPRPFSERQTELLKTFADQAVIAIENVRLVNETRDALDRQTATAEILTVMSNSTVDVQPVFDAIVKNVQRLFGTRFAVLQLVRDGQLVLVAYDGQSGFERVTQEFPRPASGDSIAAKAIRARATVQLAPIIDNPAAPERSQRMARTLGYNALIATPLVRADGVIGAIVTGHQDDRPFSDKQAELLKAFADQAVIAIENVRLFNQTKEALEQQKAAGEVLSAISSSIADTTPVFDKILDSCQRLFAFRIVGLNLVGADGKLHIGAYHGSNRAEFERIYPLPVSRESGSGLSIVERRVVHYPDADGAEVPPSTRQGCRTLGIKSVLFAPLLWEGRGVGAIFVGRDRVGSFSEREVAQLRTFADQAAIAVENARLSKHKSEFLAHMSHELRTPLNAIIGFTRIVMRNAAERLEPKQVENLEKILGSGERLLGLINQILDLSRIDAGRLGVEPAEIGLAPLLEQCLRMVEPLVGEGVKLEKDFGADLPRMVVDEEKLRQIVINLLANALKFTERGAVRLSAKAASGGVAIAISDTGIGIPADKLDLIFEEFEQADAGSTRLHGGSGLGLAISRRLARLMGGEVTVESAPGAGSTFRVTLPLRYGATERRLAG